MIKIYNYIEVIEFSMCYEISGSMEGLVIVRSFEVFFISRCWMDYLKVIDGWNLSVKDFEIFGNGSYLENRDFVGSFDIK